MADMDEQDRESLRKIMTDYGTQGVLTEMIEWLDEKLYCKAMANAVREFLASGKI